MSARNAAVIILLSVGVGVELLCSIGVLVMHDAFDRLHYIGPASTLGLTAIVSAIVVAEVFSSSGLKAIVIAALILLTNAVLTHATGRAAYIRRYGQLDPLPSHKSEQP